jgi:asparagine synthase (glutamine-hydrolysing)
MCGIVGYFSPNSELDDVRKKIRSAEKCLEHRGPDGRGAKEYPLNGSSSWHFSHRRLAIIDLSEFGFQPFESRDGRYVLTYNGEIYNYKELRRELERHGVVFRTSSDTEVLLESLIRWGLTALEKLEGMFAFSFLDIISNRLLLARDPFGIKPLYYSKSANSFGFGSEPRALRSLFPELGSVNEKVAADFLFLGFTDKNSQSFFDGIVSLLPGHYMIISSEPNLSASTPTRYWKPGGEVEIDIGFNDAVDRFRELLLESVELHMRSDVPVGAAISGGVDSSTIACLMREVSPNSEIHTFSYIAADPGISEEAWVDIAVEATGSVGHKVRIDKRSLFEADIDNLILAQGEPFSTLSIYAQFKVFELAKQTGIKVTLDGQGADELLAGYHGYPEARMLGLLEKGDLSSLIKFAQNWGGWPGRSSKSLLGVALAELLPNARRYSSLVKLAQLLGFVGDQSLELFSDQARILASQSSDMSKRDTRYKGRRLAETLGLALGPAGLTTLLRFADRNSMHSSIESRVPFLNRKLAEFTLSLPETYLLSEKGETKHILREAMRGIVPDSILNRKDKIGFEASTGRWGVGSKLLLEISNNLESIPLIDSSQSHKAIRSVFDGTRQLDSSTWRVINFARWTQLEGIK